MNEFNKELKELNKLIEELELKILKHDFDLKYMKVVLNKTLIKKRLLLTNYKSHF